MNKINLPASLKKSISLNYDLFSDDYSVLMKGCHVLGRIRLENGQFIAIYLNGKETNPIKNIENALLILLNKARLKKAGTSNLQTALF